MATRDLTIKIRTSLAWTDLMAGLELVADSADNITVDVMPVKRGYKKRGKPKPKRHPELEYERSPAHGHNGIGEQYDRIAVDASLKKNNLQVEDLMGAATAVGTWQYALKTSAQLQKKANGGLYKHNPETCPECINGVPHGSELHQVGLL